MNFGEILSSVGGFIIALGGFEFFKWFFTRKSRERIAAAEAEAAELKAEQDEYHLLRERLEFMDKQMLDKEQRFDEQTNRLRDTTKQLMEQIKENGLLASKIAALEAERAMKLCQVRNCPKREPQSGY